jgi:protein SCO1/2
MTRLLLALALLISATVQAVALDPLTAAGIDHKPDARVPFDLAFTDESGAVTTLRRLSGGKPILLVPVQHHCPNICGVTLAGLAQAIAGQSLRPGADFVTVAFGIDPREGPRDAATSLDRLRSGFAGIPADAIHALTGKAGNIASVTAALGYRYAWDPQLRQYDHVAATAVLTADGRLARWLYGVAPAPQDLKLALLDAGQGKTGVWTDQLILLCYHYDPATGRYSNVIWTALRLLGAAMVAIVALAIGRDLYRDHRMAGGRS